MTSGINIEVVYENQNIIVVNKPNNVLVHHSHYARNILDDSLLQLCRKQGLGKLYPVNRLDRKTSGLILLCKEKDNVSAYQDLFTSKEISKKYKALLRGHLQGKGVIKTPVKNENGNYKDAHSIYQPLKHYTLDIPVVPYPTSRYTLVEFEPVTGRTHQLRIHSNKLAHPIVGDHKYGNRHHNKMFADNFGIDNLYLHSFRLSFTDPFNDEKISLKIDLPAFWNNFLQSEKLSIV